MGRSLWGEARFRWSSHIRPLLLVGVLLFGGHYVSSLLSEPVLVDLTPEEWIRDSARIGWGPAIESESIAADIEKRVNDERRARGLLPLVWSDDLAELARHWSEEMIATGYRHSPDSFRVHPDFAGTGENIAMGQTDASTLHVGWMESDGHRQNILKPEYKAIGIGVVCRSDGRMWATQIFGVPHGISVAEIGVPPAEPIVRRDPGPSC